MNFHTSTFQLLLVKKDNGNLKRLQNMSAVVCEELWSKSRLTETDPQKPGSNS
jgi:hypothetical protein